MAWDFVDGAIEKLEKTVRDWLTGGIELEFDSIQSLLNSTFESATDSTDTTGLVTKFLTTHPARFGNAGGSPYSLWNLIQTVCDNAIVPIGGFVLTIILLGDLYQMLMRGNNFKDFDDTIFIKWIIKCLCGVILISNVYYIASALFSFGTGACSSAISTLFGTTYTSTVSLSGLEDMEISQLLIIIVLGLLVLVGVLLMLVFIIVTLAGRIIEIFMYFSIGPIPMATLMSEGEWSSVGKNWIRQLLALSFQGFFIIVAIAIFKTLFQESLISLSVDSDNVLTSMATLLGYTFALCFTILRTANIIKSVFNAH